MEQGTTHTADHRHRIAVLIAVLVGLGLVAAMITRTSEAAFTAATDNTGNFFNGGTVTLSDDDSTTALFQVDAMEPGQTETGCIQLTYDGTIPEPSAVKVYSGGYTNVTGPEATSAGLSDHLLVTIEEGTGATFNDCSAFVSTAEILTATALTTFDTDHSDYATGVGTWTPTTGDSISYRVTVTLDADTPDTEEGAGTTDVGFTWEIVN